MQPAVELARVLWGLLQLALAARRANRRAQPLDFGVRMLGMKSVSASIVVEQSVAPRLGAMHQRHRGSATRR